MFGSISSPPSHLIRFITSTEGIALPERFTFPFYYDPHPLALIAAKELQNYLNSQQEWDHNFGLEQDKDGLVIGKMFGVLVVKDSFGELGYLAAFSGKLANQNHHSGFVPPVFDVLEENGLFKSGEKIINAINSRIEELESSPELHALKSHYESEKRKASSEIENLKSAIKQGKKERKEKRQLAETTLSENDLIELLETLRQQSIREQYTLKDLVNHKKEVLAAIEEKLHHFTFEIEQLKEERKIKSSALQQKIFDQYFFLNHLGEQKSLGEIFRSTSVYNPPAGSGECAAPKLLQYAYVHQLEPIALAEFWWGQSPASEVRKHGNFYPACRGKCEPILGHMLQGLTVDPNPMLNNPADGKSLEIVYEDDYIVVVNKPAEFLSVPGINIIDSVHERMRLKYPQATGPLIVHRLDMSTSGLLLIAKDKDVHKHLQNQFIRRKISKRYVALLDGQLKKEGGLIDLPLRVDLDDRPRQMVCREHGKYAQTRWEIAERIGDRTKVYFYPITGRTHQLRVHASHPLGLNTAIVGDDLYGVKANRLHLHAETLIFTHPITKESIHVQVDPDF